VAWVAVKEPLQLFAGFIQAEGAFWKITAHFGVAVHLVQLVQVSPFQVAQQQTIRFQNFQGFFLRWSRKSPIPPAVQVGKASGRGMPSLNPFHLPSSSISMVSPGLRIQ
jgi:hypothetical protein